MSQSNFPKLAVIKNFYNKCERTRKRLIAFIFLPSAAKTEVRTISKYRYLTLDDRKKLARLYLKGDRPQDIAKALGVHVATIYKELKRGDTGEFDKNMRQGYSATLAQRRLQENMKRRGKPEPRAAE